MGQCLNYCGLTTVNPEIAVHSVTVPCLTWMTGGNLVVTLTVKNPNGFPIEIRQVQYSITKASDGIEIAKATSYQKFTVLEGAKDQVELPPVDFTDSGKIATEKSLYERGQTDLIIQGEVKVYSEVSVQEIVVSFQSRSNLEFLD